MVFVAEEDHCVADPVPSIGRTRLKFQNRNKGRK